MREGRSLLGTENCRLGTTSYGGRTLLGAASAAWRWKSASLSASPTTFCGAPPYYQGPLTTLDIENTFNVDRDQMRRMKGGQIGKLAIWHRTTHAALLREAGQGDASGNVRQSEVRVEDSLALPSVHFDELLSMRSQERSIGAVQPDFLLRRQFVALLYRVRGFGDQSI